MSIATLPILSTCTHYNCHIYMTHYWWYKPSPTYTASVTSCNGCVWLPQHRRACRLVYMQIMTVHKYMFMLNALIPYTSQFRTCFVDDHGEGPPKKNSVLQWTIWYHYYKLFKHSINSALLYLTCLLNSHRVAAVSNKKDNDGDDWGFMDTFVHIMG